MKTKHLLIALALPSLFAACTAEEFENGNDTVALKNRTPLGDITLDFGGNADTRLGLGDNSFYAFNWVDGDDLGASLIDTRNGTDISGADADHITGYNLTTTPQTNYRYEYNAGKWTSNAAMVEGNYVFYMPYVENTNREATMAVLPTTQTLEKRTIEGKDAYTTYNNVLSQAKENGNIMAVAYKFLTAQGENNDGNKSINIAFKQLYATPMFTISNYAQDKDGKLTDLTIKKIELSLKSNAKFTVKSPLKYTSSASNTAYTEANGTNKSIVAQLNENLKEDDETVKVGPWVNQKEANNVVPRATSDLLDDTYREEDATNAKITINLAEPVTVKKAESFSFYAVIPGGDYSVNNLIVTLTTTDNLSASVEMPAVKINPGKRYAIEGYNADGTLGTGADALFNVITEKLTESTIDGIPVATQAELLQTLATAQKDDNGTIDMKIIPAEGVVLDNQIIAMLTSKKTDIKSVTFNGDMVVNGLTNITAVPVTINGKATLKGTVSAELVSTATANKIFVEKDITIDAAAKATLNGTAKAAIINNGELTVATALTATKVTNNKTLKLAADLTGTNGIINAAEGTINVTAASTLAGKLTNKGAVVVDKDKTLTTAAVDNEKTVTVNGTLAMSSGAAFDNKKDAEIIVAGTLNDVNAASLINNGKITVNEGATATMNVAASINKNVIDNAGTLTVQKNSGTINMTNTSKFGTNLVTVTDKATDANGATVWGTIMNPNGKTVDSSTLAGTTGQRVWKSKDAVTGDFNLAAENLAYNAVNFGANVKFTAESSAALSKFVYANFNGSTIKVTTTSTTQEVGMPLVVDIAGSVEVEYDGTYAPELVFPQNAELNIAKGAELGWTKKVDITGNSTSGLLITNKGTVYNHTGSSATNIDSSSLGVWENGTTGNATNWKGATATALP